MANKPAKTKAKSKIAAFFETRMGHGLLAGAAIVLGYTFASLAINSGSLLDWLIAIVLTIIAVRELAAFIRLSFKKSKDE